MESAPPHIRAFFDSQSYPHPADNIEMIQTHISWVFLAGDYAYKFKKPVNFGFLDFTTPEKRKLFCQRELALNRIFFPELYLGMHSICRNGDSYTLDGDGDSEILDYCLKMKRFLQNDLLDRKLQAGTFNPSWMDALAIETAEFHRQSDSNSDIDVIGLLQAHIETNLEVASRHLDDGLNAETISQLSSHYEQVLPDLIPLLQRRQQAGFIRHCHGDLHLKNIALVEDRPRLFDCIEFNDDFSTIDTMNDVAFLIMDCDARKRPDLGLRFLSRYLDHSGDYAGLMLLPLYLFYRATVRGKVACLMADELTGEARAAQFLEASIYFELALSYWQRRPASLFAIGGLSGSGKSHLALLGCGAERAIIIRSDATRKRIAPLHPQLALYSKQMHIITYAAMFDAARSTLDAGFSVILDATFIHPDSRKQLKAVADKMRIPLHLFWLDIDESLLRERVNARQLTATDISDADTHVLNLQLEEYERPSEAWLIFLNSSNSWPSGTGCN
ncbi:MAG: hypothetical protein CO186_04725 [Zetaproteobacteria bacterium CG_4_9_14_3_um_filter_49_83]|nr:MAG: hypothetical protein AUJ56_00610 [Zetaproteobacteria bacterium CG1_02_49_23]PIQ31512.1 MAG: hypothetical protein COW62_09610 [Zetaproteobacteria bacterium CG17_big_fil_post_rev_8_21_14_2_50_50_13]PIV29682.1 MAG: hypothetical protein COS35_10670 [Zetaproteobacteria bacterium CG02_land_8_20_14_3_00_50_9]PIY54609.1 MAG: hypothetical protein COZ00_13755 [Zetaproteobacteria bacterium CG_4_10_14_0_8_um_filter_49_80]PJA35661.1 MAG: hypothetical protein CO186_04725 [Zetaproteobacteria bacterium